VSKTYLACSTILINSLITTLMQLY